MENILITPSGFSTRRLVIRAFLRLARKEESSRALRPRGQYYIAGISDTLVSSHSWPEDDGTESIVFDILLGDIEINVNGNIAGSKVSSDVTILNSDTREVIAEHSCDFDIEVEFDKYLICPCNYSVNA